MEGANEAMVSLEEFGKQTSQSVRDATREFFQPLVLLASLGAIRRRKRSRFPAVDVGVKLTKGRLRKLGSEWRGSLISQDQREKCAVIIRGASAAAAGAGVGLAQIPASDLIVVVPIQVGMIMALGRVFDIDLTERTAREIALKMAGPWIARGLSQVLVGWLPGVGNVLNAATAVAITESIGWSVAKRLAQGEISEMM